MTPNPTTLASQWQSCNIIYTRVSAQISKLDNEISNARARISHAH
jgi:hypothetical protein